MPPDQIHAEIRSDFIVAAERSAADPNVITFPLSSEAPFRRWDGFEILDHTSEAVDLSFLNSGNAPLLDSHCRDELECQIGVIQRAWLKDGRLYVEVRFSRKEGAQEILTDIMDGIIRNVSVGYDVLAVGPLSPDTQEYRVTRWKPTEASFVTVPADATVGIGRNATAMRGQQMPPDQIETTPAAVAPVAAAAAPAQVAAPNTAPAPVNRGAEIADATREIYALARSHNQFDLAEGHIDAAIRAGQVPSLAAFRGVLRAAIPADVPLVNRNIGLTQREQQRFSVLRLASTLADNATASDLRLSQFEREACEAAARNAEVSRSGYMLPMDLMDSWSNFSMGGEQVRGAGEMQQRAAVSTGVQTQVQFTQHLGDRFIDNLRNASSVLQAGVTVLGGLDQNVEIPGGNANTAGAWLAAEDANAAETVPTFRKVSLSIKDVAGYTDLTRRMMMQSSIDVEAYIRAQLTRSMIESIDLAGLTGSGAAGVPLGVKNTAGIGAVSYAAVGPLPIWSEIVAMETAVANANALLGNTAYIGPTSLRGYLKTTEKAASSGARFIMDSNDSGLNGYKYVASNQVIAADLYFGNWSDLLMGMWGGLSLDRDLAAKFLAGGVRIRAIQSVDFAVARVGSFCIGN